MEHVEQVVLLIHGIRTQADWQPMLVEILEETGKIKVIPIKYGYFDPFRFWLPGFTRRAPIKRVETLLRATRKKYPHARISVIAHSFGSYIIGRLLKEQVDLELDRLILCGSVLPASYPWEEVVHKFIDGSNENILNVINEYGEKDTLPVWAKATSWGYGDSGTHGFGHVFVQDRNHNIGHNEYLTRDFATTYWKPFIENGGYKPTKSEVDPNSWLLSVLGLLPLQWLFVALVVVLGVVGYSRLSSPEPPKQLPIPIAVNQVFKGYYICPQEKTEGYPQGKTEAFLKIDSIEPSDGNVFTVSSDFIATPEGKGGIPDRIELRLRGTYNRLTDELNLDHYPDSWKMNPDNYYRAIGVNGKIYDNAGVARYDGKILGDYCGVFSFSSTSKSK